MRLRVGNVREVLEERASVESEGSYWVSFGRSEIYDLAPHQVVSDLMSNAALGWFNTPVPSVDQYCAVLENGRLLGDRRVVTRDDVVLIDLSQWRAGEVQRSEGGDVIDVPDHLPHEHLDVEAFVLTYGFAAANNLSHWLSDVVVNFKLIEQLPLHIKVVVHDNVTGYYASFLQRLGIADDRIIRVNHERSYSFRKLIVPSLQMQVFTRDTMDIFDKIRNPTPSNRPDARRLYISRSDTIFGTGRNLLNEPDVEDVFRQHGFRILHGRDFTLESSIDMMASADVVAGPYGAGLYHSVFMRPGTHVIAISHNRYWLPHIAQIATLRGLNLSMLVGEHIESNDFHFGGAHSNFVISPNCVRRTLRGILAL